MSLAGNERASDQVRAVASFKLHALRDWLNIAESSASDSSERAHLFFAAQQIALFEKDPKRIDLTPPAEPPDGPPIGSASGDFDDTDFAFTGWN
jgi:hypothetical protein